MPDWPPLTNANLISRLAMPNDEFAALALRLARRIEPRTLTDEAFERALSYPWERPAESYWIEDGSVELLSGDARPAASGGRRWPLLAFGSNGAPGVLARKLSVLPEDDRDVLVLAGELTGYTVGPSAHLALYGSLPATIEPLAAATERAAILMVTAQQFEALTLTEFNYRVVRLSGAPFVPDLDVPAPSGVLAYVSRWGVFDPGDGATGQAELLDVAARMILGPKSDARELVARVFGDYAWSLETAAPVLAAHSRPFGGSSWEVFSSSRAERMR
ncbi:MAG: hypothetical protein QM648_11435 [Solirubrobacterales bacterium]